jgi:SSS family solute:Na+ symporter
VDRFVWKRGIFAQETTELAGLPWFKNFRVLSVALLIVTAIFVFIWR